MGRCGGLGWMRQIFVVGGILGGGEVNYGAIVSKYMTFILRTTYMGRYSQKKKLDTEEMPMPGLNPMLCQTYVVH